MNVDASASVENSKKERLFDGHGSCYNCDRISNLPDSILHYILSFLPTKHAVGSSVLSTRWKYLWTSIHSLEFWDKLVFSGCKSKNYLKRRPMFYDFVDRVLLLNDVPNIHRFSLKCKVCDAAHFNKWIFDIMQRKVQELNISIPRNGPSMFLRWPFTSESLRILKIDIDDHIKIPASVCCPLLEVLHLRNVQFSGLESANKICLSFPLLEDCILYNCKWWRIETVNVHVPSLQKLTIYDWEDILIQNCEIRIKAECLTSIEFRTNLTYEYSLLHLSSLVKAVFNISRGNESVHRVCSFFRGIFNVRDLSFSADCIKTLSAPVVLAHLHSLSSLTHLRVLRGYTQSIRTLINFLCDMPNVESLSFPDGLYLTFLFRGQGRIIGTTPRCFLPLLKLVEIRYFDWKQDQLWFVKFLMKSVTNTDTLIIKLPRRRSGREKLSKELEDLATRSNCLLEYTLSH